jgi:hypothetical protein
MFKASALLQKHLLQEQQLLTKDRRGMYRLSCHDGTGCYIGQTGRSCKGHISYILLVGGDDMQ